MYISIKLPINRITIVMLWSLVRPSMSPGLPGFGAEDGPAVRDSGLWRELEELRWSASAERVRLLPAVDTGGILGTINTMVTLGPDSI